MMKEEYSALFSPIRIGRVQLKNRYVMEPMGPAGLADDNGNLIVINPDFEYIPVQDEAGDFQQDQRSLKIGFNNTEAKCSGDFCKGDRPVLLVDDKTAGIADLEDTPALKRR